MLRFNSTLLREKFLIEEAGTHGSQSNAKGDTVTAVSNRITVPVRNKKGEMIQEFVVRTHTMHSCMRMAARIVEALIKAGTRSAPLSDFNWHDTWSEIMTDKQIAFDPDYWCVVYRNGDIAFQDKRHNVFFDVIEKFAFKFDIEYEASVIEAEKAFMRAGKKVNIQHDSQIAAIIDIRDKESKAGIILRSPKRVTTCNIIASSRDNETDHITTAFDICSKYLEGIHHGFIIGLQESLINSKKAESVTRAEAIIEKSRDRIIDIQNRIKKIEREFQIQYRPEKPSFKKVISDTIDFHR